MKARILGVFLIIATLPIVWLDGDLTATIAVLLFISLPLIVHGDKIFYQGGKK